MNIVKGTALRILGSVLLFYATVFVWPMWHDFVHETGHAVAFINYCPGSSALVSLGEYESYNRNTSVGEIAYNVYPGYFYHSLYRTSQAAQVPPSILSDGTVYKEFGNDTSKYPAEYIEFEKACYGGNRQAWFLFAGPLFGLVLTYATFTCIMVVVMAFLVPWGPVVESRSKWKTRLIIAVTRAPLVLFVPERAFLNHLHTSIPGSTRILYAFCIRIVQADLLNEIFYGWIPGRTIIFTWSINMDGPGWWSSVTGASEHTMLIVSYVLWVPLLGLYLYGVWLMYGYTRRILAEWEGQTPSQIALSGSREIRDGHRQRSSI
ncbi:hypothetical protein EDB81DRAFT_785538, partial [Dactylonectria macrodidyma]